tara:strand:- start:20 stop:250 length:231 start_codon:yes stop_codon:yes gene_type:complete
MARQQKTSNTQNLAWVVWTGGMVDGTFPEASMVSSSGLDGNLVRDGIAGWLFYCFYVSVANTVGLVLCRGGQWARV